MHETENSTNLRRPETAHSNNLQHQRRGKKRFGSKLESRMSTISSSDIQNTFLKPDIFAPTDKLMIKSRNGAVLVEKQDCERILVSILHKTNLTRGSKTPKNNRVSGIFCRLKRNRMYLSEK